MEINTDLLLFMLSLALISGTFSTLFIQKFKELPFISKPWQVVLFSIIVNLALGAAWSYTLTDIWDFTPKSFIIILLVGLTGFIGAEAVYNAIKDKWSYFQPLSKMAVEIATPTDKITNDQDFTIALANSSSTDHDSTTSESSDSDTNEVIEEVIPNGSYEEE